MYLNSLKNIYDHCVKYAQYVNDGKWMEDREDFSKFWEQAFQERINYPAFNDMLTMRRVFTYSLADRVDLKPQIELKAAKAAYAVISHTIPESYIKSLNESALGCPKSL